MEKEDPPQITFPCIGLVFPNFPYKGPFFLIDDEQPPKLVVDLWNVDVEDLKGDVEDLDVALDDLSVGVKGQKLTLPLKLGTEDALSLS